MGLTRAKAQVGVDALPAAGELLAVEAIDRTGLAITSEGAFVRIVRVTPPNPLILSADGRAELAAAFCGLVGRLRADQSLQFYVQARPVNLEQLLAASRREVEAAAGPPPTADSNGHDAAAVSRWRLYGAMEESLRRHADEQAAVDVSAFVVVPYLPRQQLARATLAQLRAGRGKLRTAPLERELAAHRRAARESLAHTDQIRSELEALGIATDLLDGERVIELLWRRFNPTRAERRTGSAPRAEVLGELDAARDRDEARSAALKLREAVARSALDFVASSHHASVDRDVEQTIFCATTAHSTSMGWLLGAMLTRQPYALSVYVHALDRRRERQKLKFGYKRLFAVNRSAEQRGRVPDFDRYAQEREYAGLLDAMASRDRANVFEVSIYQTLRARGPQPDLAALEEAVDYCVEEIESASDCKVNRGQFMQEPLWVSSLPLGRDVAGRSRKYATANVGDTLPLVGTSCGSPSGVPFAFADPGRTVERLDPYDPDHANFTMLISGRSGTGKTMAASVILSRCLAHGARAFVLDRAGHYRTLTHLVEGAQEIALGADDSPYAINPWDVPDPWQVSREKVQFLLSLHTVMMGDEGLGRREIGQLAAAIRAVYARAANDGDRPRENLLRRELKLMAEHEQAAGAPDAAASLRNLSDRLTEFCGDGTYAYLLDRDTTVPADSALVVFDTRRCPDDVLQPVMFALTEYVTSTVERHWRAHQQQAAQPGAPRFTGRSILLIDEAWHLVGRRETGQYANDLARRARHLGLFLIVMSQQLSDFNTEHGLALLQNATMQLLLAQHPNEIPFVQAALQHTDEEAAFLGRLKTVKGSHAQMLWVNGTRGRGRVALRVGPTEYWAFTSDPAADVPLREAVIAEHDGDVWAAITHLARGHARTAAA